MARSRTTPFTIRRPDQMRVLTSPVRQEMVDALVASGPCSIAELATLLGRAPDALYYHVRKLEDTGLMVPSGQVKAGRRDAAVYDVPGRPLTIDQESIDAITRPIVRKSCGAMIRSAHRDMTEALDSGVPFGHGKRRRAWVGRTKGWFTAAEMAEVNAHLKAIVDLFAQARRRRGRRLHTFTYVLTPIEASQRGQDRNE